MQIKILLLFALLLAPLTPDQVKRIERLEDKLMAPCCYTQTIRVHMSDVAEQMREEVTDKVAAGESDQEILNYYKAKYGATILVVPDGWAGRFAFGIPVVITLLAAGVLFLLIFRFKRAKTVANGLPAKSEEELHSIRRRIQEDAGEDL